MVMILKKGLYFTLNFKVLFSGVLVGCLVISFILFVTLPKKSRTASSESINKADCQKQLVVVDAGHGGEDGGTVSSKGVNEKVINLEISEKLKLILCLCGYKTKMTRENDALIYDGTPITMREKKVSDLRNRLKLAESDDNALFLSVHQNYFTESKYWGTQVFYSANHADSKILAEHIQNSVVKSIQTGNTRKVKESGQRKFKASDAG